jgi:dihydroorotate dehydrogenase
VNLLPPEVSYSLSRYIISRIPCEILRLLYSFSSDIGVNIGNKYITPPIGNAAGLDKDGELLRKLNCMAFGFLTVGSVLATQRKGNNRPIIARNKQEKTLVNSVGLPSKGINYVKRLLNNWNGKPILVNIAGFSDEELIELAEKISKEQWAWGIEINLSSPTYRGAWLNKLKDTIVNINSNKPTFIKLSPIMSDEEILSISNTCSKKGYGVTVFNTYPIEDDRLSTGYGGLSGSALFSLTLKTVTKIRENYEIPIIACGGVFSGRQMALLLNKGADLVEIYTSIIYRGLSAPKKIIKEFEEIVKSNKLLPYKFRK